MESLGDILRRLQQQSLLNADVPEWVDQLEAESSTVAACPTCGGQGWVRRDVPVGHPDFGRAFPCRCLLEENEANRLARLQRYSNLGVLRGVTFETLDEGGPGVSLEARARYHVALQASREFAAAPKGSLLLTGGHGTGKTRLTAAVANRIMAEGKPVLFTFVPDLLDQLRGAYSNDAGMTHDELFEQVKNVPVLVLDDLGAHSGTPWAEEKLFQIVNHRYINVLPTLITSTVPFERLDGRLRSKLDDPRSAKVIDLGGAANPKTVALGSIPDAMLRNMTFESFQPLGKAQGESERQSLAHALHASRSFAQEPEGWLVMFGESGCGKTHLAVAVANRQLEQGGDVFFAFVPDLLDHLRYTFSPDSRVTYDELFDRIKQAPLLVLDDYGSENSTAWAQEKLYQIIVHRQNAFLPTVITMRRLPEQGTGDPVASRLNDISIVSHVPIIAPDYRNSSASPSKKERRRYDYS